MNKTTSDIDKTIAEMVLCDYRKARILKKLGLDFILNGNKTIQQVCEENKLIAADVWLQLDAADAFETKINYLNWDIVFLISYISQLHHRFVNTQTKFVIELAHKVAESNKLRHPEIKEIAKTFNNAGELLELKAQEEEKTLFPYIISLDAASAKGAKAPLYPGAKSIYQYLVENNRVLDDLRLIRMLTNNFVAPAYSSSTCPILYRLLKQYEDDTHLHLHLENNILFPRAIEMEALLHSKQLTA